MPHLSGKCDCGRPIHLPKSAQYGHKWTCHQCGKTWNLANHGKPLHNHGSRPPPAGSGSGSGSGCLVFIVAAALATASAASAAVILL